MARDATADMEAIDREARGDGPLDTLLGDYRDYVDFASGLIEKNAKAEPTAEELGVKPASRRLEDMRLGVRGVLHGLGSALDTLEDCVTYLDGFRSGCLVASGDVPGMGGIQNLFVDLRGVEDSMQRIHSELEDIVTGGDHE